MMVWLDDEGIFWEDPPALENAVEVDDDPC